MRISFNGEPRDLQEATTIADLLADLGLDPRRVAVEINLELAPRDRHTEIRVQEGDQVEVVTLVGGG